MGGHTGDFQFNGETVDLVRRPPGVALGTFALYVQGESMFPRFRRGDLVYVTDTRPAKAGDDVVIELHPAKGEQAGACLIKELVRVGGERVTLREYQPARRDFSIEARRVLKIWRIYTTAELFGAG